MRLRSNMNSLFSKTQFVLCGVAAFVFSGCGEYGGGASVVPNVTVLPADLGGNIASTEETGAQAETVSESAGGSGLGSLVGRVVLDGTATNLPPLIAMGADVKDKEVCAKFDVPDERLVLGADNGVANVFVYMQKAPKGSGALESTDEALIFDQQYCRFKPHCLIVPTGVTVKVLSEDTVAHNTHSYPNKNQGVNSGVAPGDREGKLQITYNRAESEPIAVKCDYHAWMNAYHLPIDHTFAAITDENGKFEIPNLPAGEHTFAVWHEAASGKFVERKLVVTIASGQAKEVEIKYPSSKLEF